MTLLSIPSPRAFFPITWNSYSVLGMRLLIVTVVLPDGVTGIVCHSEVPDSLCLCVRGNKSESHAKDSEGESAVKVEIGDDTRVCAHKL